MEALTSRFTEFLNLKHDLHIVFPKGIARVDRENVSRLVKCDVAW